MKKSEQAKRKNEMAALIIESAGTRVVMTCCSYRTPHTFVREFDSVEDFKAWTRKNFCPECQKPFLSGKAIVGTYNEKKSCNAKCMGATSGVCECSCGGENHGASHNM